MKRFTSASHFILGFALSIAPVGGFLSTQVEGYGWNATTAMILLVIAILTWVSGFDIIYSLGDVGFDRKSHLYSIPARWGVKRSLYLVSGLYALSVLFLYLVRFFTPVTGYAYLISCVIAGVLLAYQIRIAGNGEWKHAFDLNMWVSPLILLGLIIDVCIL
jgi:4-hydroxybenzoate polyprenyltransferase